MKTCFYFWVFFLPLMVNAQLSFAPHTGHGLPAVNGVFLNVDVNEDGYDDVFIAGNTSSVGVPTAEVVFDFYLGNGNGIFGASGLTESMIPTGYTNDTTRFVDIDNDGDLDLILIGGESGVSGFYIYFNNGGGNFELVQTYPLSNSNYYEIQGLVVADFDNDGYLDFAIMENDLENYATILYRNNQNGFFYEMIETIEFPGGEGYIAVHDFDNDGWIDIAISTYDDEGKIKVFKNHGNFEFSLALEITAPFNAYMTVGDINGDGYVDIIAGGAIVPDSGPWIPRTYIYFNNGGMGFSLNQEIPLGACPCGSIGRVWLVDIDNDGDLDLFLVGHPGTALTNIRNRLYPNDGSGVFNEYIDFASIADEIYPGGYPGLNANVVFLDFDNDGKTDIIKIGRNIVGVLQIHAFRNTSTLSVSEHNQNSYSIYPNPTEGILHIENSNGSDIDHVILADMSGRTMFPQLHNNSIDISGYASGVYLLTLVQGDMTTTKKIVKK